MNKIIISGIAILSSALNLCAASFLYTGSANSDILDYQNFYALSSDITSNDVYSQAIYLYSKDFTGDMKANCPETGGGVCAKYENATDTSKPSSNDTIYLHSYKFADTSTTPITWGAAIQPQYPVSIKESFTAGEILSRGGALINLGSSTSVNSNFALNLKNFKVGYSNLNISIAEGATQNNFQINISESMYLRGGNTNNFKFGSSTGYIDMITIKKVENQGKLTLYTGGVSIGTGGFKNTSAASLSLHIDNAILNYTTDAVFFDVYGTFEKSANLLDLDFTDVKSDVFNKTAVYNLIAAESLVGFDTSDVTKDFTSSTFASIERIFGENAFLQWNDNILQLSVNIPEPTTYAAIFAILSFTLITIRRKK